MISPFSTEALFGKRPIIERLVTVLPEPDSPTKAKTYPSLILNEILFKAGFEP